MSNRPPFSLRFTPWIVLPALCVAVLALATASIVEGEAAAGAQQGEIPRTASGRPDMNGIWRARLAGTVWRNYHLVSTQWRGNYGGEFFNVGEVPRYLSNSVIETYVQADKSGSCLGCHTSATTATGADGNFTFLLGRAR